MFGTRRAAILGHAAVVAASPLISAINGAFQTNDTGGWTATWASGTPPTFAPDSAPVTFTASRPGFDASGNAATYVDTFTYTQRVRQAYPSQASLTTNIVALSDVIYSTDTVAGVTNNSPLASPVPVANWVMPHRLTVGNTVNLEIVAFHRDARAGKQVACVKFIATDGSTTVSQIVSAAAISGRAGDQFSVITYACALDITTLATGLITCNAEVYPWIGDTTGVAKSVNNSGGRQFSPRYFLKNAALLATPFFVYLASTGSDTTGVCSATEATAAAAPCLTLKGALAKAQTAAGKLDNVIVKIVDTVQHGGNAAASQTQNVGALVVTRAPGTTRANAILNFGATTTFRPKISTGLTSPLTTGAIRFTDMTIVRTGTQSFQGESANQLELIFDDVSFDNGGNNAAWLNQSHDYFFGGVFTNLTGNSALAAGTYEHRCLRGITVDLNGGTAESWLTIGSYVTRPGSLDGGAARSESGTIIAFNWIRNSTSTTCFTLGFVNDVIGAANVQNVWEYCQASVTPNENGVSNDSAAGNNTHVIIHNNTYTGFFSGGRVNHFYDEGATERYSKLMSCKANDYVQIDHKGDVFRAVNQSGVDAATRVGNWSYLYGVGCQGEFSQYIDANSGGLGGSFAQAYPGLGCNLGLSSTVRNDPLFTSYQGTTSGPTVGAGGGDYHVASNSPCKAMVASAVLPFDLAGAARSATADTAGAYA